MRYITEEIGQDFENWIPGKTIFLSSPTGSGKTTFIFETYLPYCAENNIKILYLVNRSVLKKQLEKKVSHLPLEQKGFIHVETYQALEEIIIKEVCHHHTLDSHNGYRQGIFDLMKMYNMQLTAIPQQASVTDIGSSKHLTWLSSFNCVVCDECHYFLTDSNFNRNTILSYNFVRKFFGGKRHIFISATIDSIQEHIDDGRPFGYSNRSDWLGLTFDDYPETLMEFSETYFCDRKYDDYVDLDFIKSIEEIIPLISSVKGKWLIFVDSKKTGNFLREEIEKLNKSQIDKKQRALSVAFVTAEYSSNEESSQEVSSIVEYEKQNADVLISTSVLDNGINIEDDTLRNLIIMADNETEFIQMLGRKRKSSERIRVYAFLYDKGYFKNRYNINMNRKRIGFDFFSNAITTLSYNNAKRMPIFELNEQENRLCIEHSRYLVDNIFSILDRIKYTHLSYNGMLYVNPLSIRNIENLNTFYLDMIKRFEAGEDDAFMKEIVRWLDLEDKFDLEYAKLDRYDKARYQVIKQFTDNVNIPLAKPEFDVRVRKPIQNELAILIDSKKSDVTPKDHRKFRNDCMHSGRAITGPMMDFLRNNFDIPFSIEVKNKVYTIIPFIGVENENCKIIQEEQLDNNPCE